MLQPRLLLVVLAVAVSVSSFAQTNPRPTSGQPRAKSATQAVPPKIEYTPVARLSEPTRKTVFGELAGCRAEVTRKADEQYPEMKIQSPGYSAKADVKRFRERGRFEDAGTAQCSRETLKKHTLEPRELTSIMLEGVSQQWPAIAPKPSR